MQCEEVNELISNRAYQGEGEPLPDAAAGHIEGCDACRLFAERSGSLDRLLAVDQPQAPDVGFDTRFFARLREQKAGEGKGRVWRWLLAGGLPLAAAGVAATLLLIPSGQQRLSGEELELALNLELLESYELVATLDEVAANGHSLSIPLYVKRMVANQNNHDGRSFRELWATWEHEGRDFWQQMGALVETLDGLVDGEVANG